MYCSDITEINKSSLAEYVIRRKVLLDILTRTTSSDSGGKFDLEEKIHRILFPMRHTSDDVSFEEMNLWIIDERLNYHTYLASDKTIRSMPILYSDSTKEPDIAIFNTPIAYAEGGIPNGSITIVEFKKPDNDKSNPIEQVYGYISQMKNGRKVRSNGNAFGDLSNTPFYCYIICDLTPRMCEHALNASFIRTADGLGYFGYNQNRNAYVEALSYTKLLSDATKRNRVLFDKLFEPKASELLS